MAFVHSGCVQVFFLWGSSFLSQSMHINQQPVVSLYTGALPVMTPTSLSELPALSVTNNGGNTGTAVLWRRLNGTA